MKGNSQIYKPALFRRYQLLALLLRWLAGVVSLWPLFALLWFVFVSLGVHLLIKQEYLGVRGSPVLCEYLGIKGRVQMVTPAPCQLWTIKRNTK